MAYPVKNIAKETVLTAVSLLGLLFLIVVTSLANAGLDPTKLTTVESVSNLSINAAITIFGIAVALPSGIANTKIRVNKDGSSGRYLQDYRDYNTIRQKIEPKRIQFAQWHQAQYLKELHAKQVSYLLEFDILQAEDVLRLTREQIRGLTTSQMYVVDDKEVYYKSLNPVQIKACLYVLDGHVKLHKLSDYYFLYCDGKAKKSFYDQAYSESNDERFTVVVKLLYKVFIGFVVTSIWTSLVISQLTEEQTTKEFIYKALILMIARIVNAVSSTLWGMLIGREYVYRQCYYINGRTQFLQLFDSDTTFVYQNIEEQVKQEIQEREATECQTLQNEEQSSGQDLPDGSVSGV